MRVSGPALDWIIQDWKLVACGAIFTGAWLTDSDSSIFGPKITPNARNLIFELKSFLNFMPKTSTVLSAEKKTKLRVFYFSAGPPSSTMSMNMFSTHKNLNQMQDFSVAVIESGPVRATNYCAFYEMECSLSTRMLMHHITTKRCNVGVSCERYKLLRLSNAHISYLARIFYTAC